MVVGGAAITVINSSGDGMTIFGMVCAAFVGTAIGAFMIILIEWDVNRRYK